MRVAGALLSIGVVYVHLEDQSFFHFDKDPRYVLIGYIVLELAGILVAGLLLFRPSRAAWSLAGLVALGPIVGYALSRGPGLPDYADDRGNWTEPLGVFSLVVEVALLLLAGAVLARARTARPQEFAESVRHEVPADR